MSEDRPTITVSFRRSDPHECSTCGSDTTGHVDDARMVCWCGRCGDMHVHIDIAGAEQLIRLIHKKGSI